MTQPLTTDQPSVAPISDDIDDPATTGPGFFRRMGRSVWRITGSFSSWPSWRP